MYLQLINGFLNDMEKMQSWQEDWKEKILNEWEKTKKLPRKKKKQRRKELLLDWDLACWNPLNI